jgi:Cutinase
MAGKLSLVAVAFAALASGAPAPQACTGQSCDLANLSGSSGLPPPTTLPKGGTKSGNKCIASYPQSNWAKGKYPSSVLIVDDENKANVSSHDQVEAFLADRKSAQQTKRAAEISCKPYIFIFARGTTEVGTMGESVGPVMKTLLNAKMPGKWAFQGVDYPASFGGDECVGLPGGKVMTEDINQAATQCPSSKIIASGYSEGAMVAHNGVGFATASAKKKVAVSHPSTELLSLYTSRIPDKDTDSCNLGCGCIRRSI